jgi:branched-chain amino acid aminotransferase
MKVGEQVWFDGQLTKIENIHLSILSHSLHYGSAIFEGIRFYPTEEGPAVFRLYDHLVRLQHSAKAFQFRLGYSLEVLEEAVLQVIRASDIAEGYIRIIGFYGDGDMELHPTKASQHLAIIVWPWAPRMGTSSIKVKISPFMKTPPQSTVLSAKLSGHYANSILARQDARRTGYHEALLLDMKGNISEASGANFFGVKDGQLFTPPEANTFPGITRESVIALAKELKIPLKITAIPPTQLQEFDEAFLTGTAMEVISIEQVDDIVIRQKIGPITKKLKNAYSLAVKGRNSKSLNWLTYVEAADEAMSHR